MIENGRPRFWIDWYDRWYLLLPLALAGVLVAIWLFPKSASVVTSPQTRGTTPHPAGATRIADPLPPLAPTTLTSPLNGKGYFQSRLPNAEGRAQPGVTIYLEYTRNGGDWRGLTNILADTNGYFRFQLRNFPPGNYRLRARTETSAGRGNASMETMIFVAPDSSRDTRRGRTRN